MARDVDKTSSETRRAALVTQIMKWERKEREGHWGYTCCEEDSIVGGVVG
jgi:hypothetical protein